MFSRYAAGEKATTIVQDLNERGYRTHNGKKFIGESVIRIISSSSYKGAYSYAGAEASDVADRIVDDDVFDRANARRIANKRAPAASRSDASFPLYGKLFCGHCG